MKHYVGTLEISSDSSRLRSSKLVLIAAKDAKQAAKILDTFASEWEEDGNGEGGKKTESGYAYSMDDEPYVVEPISVNEITPAAFHGMEGMSRLGDAGGLAEQDAPEQAKTLARRLGEQLKRLGGPEIAHSTLLDAVAASLGETDWQSLKHKGAPRVPESTPEFVSLQLGVVVHHHGHGEDVFLFQNVPTKEEAIEHVKNVSSWEPENGESIDCDPIDVEVESSWLIDQMKLQGAAKAKPRP